MDRFVSHYTLRLDGKGRVSIPASFRAVLARDGFEGLYCYPALDRPAIDAGGASPGVCRTPKCRASTTTTTSTQSDQCRQHADLAARVPGRWVADRVNECRRHPDLLTNGEHGILVQPNDPDSGCSRVIPSGRRGQRRANGRGGQATRRTVPVEVGMASPPASLRPPGLTFPQDFVEDACQLSRKIASVEPVEALVVPYR